MDEQVFVGYGVGVANVEQMRKAMSALRDVTPESLSPPYRTCLKSACARNRARARVGS